jgi:cysteine desulfurase
VRSSSCQSGRLGRETSDRVLPVVDDLSAVNDPPGRSRNWLSLTPLALISLVVLLRTLMIEVSPLGVTTTPRYSAPTPGEEDLFPSPYPGRVPEPSGIAYLDHAASTPMRPEAIAAMTPFLAVHSGNPSGGHGSARVTKTALEEARETVAEICGCRPQEVVFTGGGSEGDNLAVKGAAWALRAADPALDGVVTTGIEHKAVLGACDRLEREGFRVVRAPATPDGVVDLDVLGRSLGVRTAVVSVMLVNNETGVRQPLPEIARLVHELAPRAVLHTDAVQAPQWLDVAEHTREVQLVALSGHKFGGPKGVGALIVRDGTALIPLIEGGGHEQGRRAGTQNVAGIVAFATALRVTHERRTEETARIAALRDELEHGLATKVPGFSVNGEPALRVAGLLHCTFEGVEAETLLIALDQHGVMAASGSACSSGAIDPSHVLLAMGMPRGRALTSVRFSLGYASTTADIDTALSVVPEVVAKLRTA